MMNQNISDCKILEENCYPLMEPKYFDKKIAPKLIKSPLKKVKTSRLLVNISILTLSLMTFIIFWFTNIYNRLLLERVLLKEGSEMLDYWVNPPIDPLVKVHVFNYTNIFDVLSGAEKKIKVNEVGPYVYRERIVKSQLTIESEKITFYENRSHTFLPHLSGQLSEDDIIMVPNLALVSGIPNAKSLGFFGELGFKSIIASTKPKEFQNLTIAQYFLGFNDDFMSLIGKIKWDFDPKDVGILAPRTGITKKSVTVFSGTGDYNDVGRVYAVDNKTMLDIWKTEECNRVKGSDGIIYGPLKVQNKEDLQVYLSNFCRSLPLEFDEEVRIMNGMRSFRYKAPFGTFSSPDNYPANKFYCELKSINQKHVDGVLDVSGCIDGNPPILISHPHFYEGSSELFEHFEGLEPNKALHESFAYIHPRLSVPLYGVSRMQINLRVNSFGRYFKNLPEGLILPLAWIETTTEEFPASIQTRLFLSTIVVDYLELFFKFGSILGIVFSLAILCLSLTNVKNIAIILRNLV